MGGGGWGGGGGGVNAKRKELAPSGAGPFWKGFIAREMKNWQKTMMAYHCTSVKDMAKTAQDRLYIRM